MDSLKPTRGNLRVETFFTSEVYISVGKHMTDVRCPSDLSARVNAMLSHCRINLPQIIHGDEYPAYNAAIDTITLPPTSASNNSALYYKVFLHLIGHAIVSRLNLLEYHTDESVVLDSITEDMAVDAASYAMLCIAGVESESHLLTLTQEYICYQWELSAYQPRTMLRAAMLAGKMMETMGASPSEIALVYKALTV